MPYVLIDESGRLPDPRDRFVVIAAVVVETLTAIEKAFLKVRRKIPRKGKRRKERHLELKYSLMGEQTRQQVLKTLETIDFYSYVLVVDKQGRKIRDTPENYGLLISETLRSLRRTFFNINIEHILIDRHFTSIHQQQKVNAVIEKRLNKMLFVQHIDSSQNPVIAVADFIAGTVRESQFRKTRGSNSGISKKIVNVRNVSWRELKSGNL